ncbi:MAG TPA: hypothetical protein PKE40_10785 [Arachnia sp.]|nr:hypothetical protein [Arachnia sp.]HMT86829.1 hypothetical protein [Arachnia sp.]
MNPEPSRDEVELSIVDDEATPAPDEAEPADTDIAQTIVTVLLFVAFLSFVVVCLPFFFFG